MKLCWLLGVLTIALCRGDVIQNSKEAITSLETNGTITKSENPQGNNRTLTKRQVGQLDDAKEKNSENDFNWNTIQDSNWQPQEKRAKFSSWAGKRDPDDSKENKRAKFSSWAGKRNPEETVYVPENSKRTKFSSWAGKRDSDLDLADKRKLLAPTLAGFSQDDLNEYDAINEEMNEEKRGRFSSWGGKRDNSFENKRKFSSWSGKRTSNLIPFLGAHHLHAPSSPIHGLNNLNTNGDNKDIANFLTEKGAEFLNWNNLGNNINDRPESIDLKGIAELMNTDIQPEYLSNSDFDINEMKRGRFSSWGGKRKFSSWGGKRSTTELDDSDFLDKGLDVEKRAKFSSWAGKRDTSPSWKSRYQGKRGKFSSWAGKRSDDLFNEMFETDKRGRFSSWGGKRGLSDQLDANEEKRTKFSSWAGKRFYNEDEDSYMDKRDTDWSGLRNKIKGRGFSSWGGKRSYDDDDGMLAISDDVNTALDSDLFNQVKKATKFSSWAGKRSQNIEEDKRKFSSWGGKRNYYELVDDPKRAKFSSWAGKRSVNPNDGPEVDKRKENRKSGLLRRYNRFNSWRGKKDNGTPLNGTQTRLEDVDFNQSGDSGSANKSKRAFNNYFRKFEMIKRNPLLRAWIGKHYPDMMTWKRRPAFSSWGGKRSFNPEVVEEIQQFDDDTGEDEKRGKFSSWGGKRGHAIDKRSVQTTTEQILQKPNPIKKKFRATNSLGTRNTLEAPRFYLRSSKDGLVAPAIRPLRRQFYAWGGKRASKS